MDSSEFGEVGSEVGLNFEPAPAGWRPPSRGGIKASGSNSGSGELDLSAPADIFKENGN